MGHHVELRGVSIVKDLGDLFINLTLETGLDHIKRVSCESRDSASGKASNGLNQRWGETCMVIIHRFMSFACSVTRKKAEGEVEVGKFAEAENSQVVQ